VDSNCFGSVAKVMKHRYLDGSLATGSRLPANDFGGLAKISVSASRRRTWHVQANRLSARVGLQSNAVMLAARVWQTSLALRLSPVSHVLVG